MVYGTNQLARDYSQVSAEQLGMAGEVFDNVIDNEIPRADRRIDRWCYRPDNFFQAGGLSITENLDSQDLDVEEVALAGYYTRAMRWLLRERGQMERKLRLQQIPVVTVTSVSELTQDVPEVYTTRTENTDFRVDKVRGIIYFYQNIPKKGFKNLQVVYTAGYTATPDNIIEASSRLVANALAWSAGRRMGGIVRAGELTVNYANPEILTPNIIELLQPYKLVRFI